MPCNADEADSFRPRHCIIAAFGSSEVDAERDQLLVDMWHRGRIPNLHRLAANGALEAADLGRGPYAHAQAADYSPHKQCTQSLARAHVRGVTVREVQGGYTGSSHESTREVNTARKTAICHALAMAPAS